MPLSFLQIRSFRNYRQLDLKLSDGITVFTGQNGIGKTTVLESIALLGNGRTFRPGKNVDIIRKNEEAAFLKGVVHNSGLTNEVEVRIYPQGKRVFLDQKQAKSTKALTELLPTIVFSPADHRIIEGDSADRKQFLNRAASLTDWDYVEDLNAYNKALLQRNRVLKENERNNWPQAVLLDLLGPWDDQLLTIGSRLIARRNFYLAALKPWVEQEYKRIAGSNDQFEIAYQAMGEESEFPADIEGEIRENFSQLLKDSLRRDLAVGSTSAGPHKDEILLTLNGNKVKFYGSQGEKRTGALALRLGELALFVEKVRRMPVLLFDDVSSELDSSRRKSLVELLRKENTQVLITATELPSSLLGDVGKNFDPIDLNALGERN